MSDRDKFDLSNASDAHGHASPEGASQPTQHVVRPATRPDPRATTAELGAWVVFGIASVIYVIAFVTLQNLGYLDDETVPLQWMAFAGMIAGVSIVPAIILTGVRQLVPALRNVRASESSGRSAEDGSSES